ncbi:hypothetical protein PBRA_001314 [Plasmodiophora brassicae]|nr:hypothetical protein PBRA_001314 [Plasmodiophora brassicae]
MLPTGIGERYQFSGRHARRLSSNVSEEDERWDERQMLAVSHMSTPHTAKIVDIYEDCERMFLENRLAQGRTRRFLRWMYRHRWALGLVVVSLVTSFILYMIGSRDRTRFILSQVSWLWSAIPGLVAITMFVSYIIEITVLNAARLFIRSPAWLYPMMQGTASGYIRVIMFAVLTDGFVFQWWLSSTAVNGVNPTTVHNVFVSVWTIGAFLVVRNVLNHLLEMWAVKKTFGKRINALMFVQDILHDLCCRSESDKVALAQIRSNNRHNKYLMASVRQIREGCIGFPLACQSDRWEFSTDSTVEVSSTKEMALIAQIVFDNIVEDKQHDPGSAPNPPVISFDMWTGYFKDAFLAAQCFRLMFTRQGDALVKQAVTSEQFIAAFKSAFNTWSVLANRLKSFQNLSYLSKTILSGIFYLFLLFVIMSIFGYNASQLVTAMSAMLLALSFALSKTISRLVECISFIFGGKPYQVNDEVVIDGNWYQVHKIGLLETQFLDSMNKCTRYSNQVLADLKLVNLSKSGNCATRVVIEIAQDTPVELVERLKASILKYAIRNPSQWKPRVSISLNDLTKTNGVDVEIRIDSVFTYSEGGAFCTADTDIKNHIRKQLTKLGVGYHEVSGPVLCAVYHKNPADKGTVRHNREK